MDGGIVKPATTGSGRLISGRAINNLSDREIESFICRAKAGKAPVAELSDGAGMFLTIHAVQPTLDHIHDSDVVRAYARSERLQQRPS